MFFRQIVGSPIVGVRKIYFLQVLSQGKKKLNLSFKKKKTGGSQKVDQVYLFVDKILGFRYGERVTT